MPAGLLRVREAAQAAHLSERTVRRLAEAGVLDAVRLGPRSTRIWAESLARLLAYGYDVAAVAAAKGMTGIEQGEEGQEGAETLAEGVAEAGGPV